MYIYKHKVKTKSLLYCCGLRIIYVCDTRMIELEFWKTPNQMPTSVRNQTEKYIWYEPIHMTFWKGYACP